MWQGGKVDRRGRLVVPCRYDDLYFASMSAGAAAKDPAHQHTPDRCFFEARYSTPMYHLDTLCPEGMRNGKTSFVGL